MVSFCLNRDANANSCSDLQAPSAQISATLSLNHPSVAFTNTQFHPQVSGRAIVPAAALLEAAAAAVCSASSSTTATSHFPALHGVSIQSPLVLGRAMQQVGLCL